MGVFVGEWSQPGCSFDVWVGFTREDVLARRVGNRSYVPINEYGEMDPRHREHVFVDDSSLHINLGSDAYADAQTGSATFMDDMDAVVAVFGKTFDITDSVEALRRYRSRLKSRVHIYMGAANRVHTILMLEWDRWFASGKSPTINVHVSDDANIGEFYHLMKALKVVYTPMICIDLSCGLHIDDVYFDFLIKLFAKFDCQLRFTNAKSPHSLRFLFVEKKDVDDDLILIANFDGTYGEFACKLSFGGYPTKSTLSVGFIDDIFSSDEDVKYDEAVYVESLFELLQRRIWMYADVIHCTLKRRSKVEVRQHAAFEDGMVKSYLGNRLVLGLDQMCTEMHISYAGESVDFHQPVPPQVFNSLVIMFSRLEWTCPQFKLMGCAHLMGGTEPICHRRQHIRCVSTADLYRRNVVVQDHAEMLFSIRYIRLLRRHVFTQQQLLRMSGAGTSASKRRRIDLNERHRDAFRSIKHENKARFRRTYEEFIKLRTHFPMLALIVHFLIPLQF